MQDMRQAIAAIGVLAALIGAGTVASAQEKDKFTFANPNAISVTTAPIFFAKELGYFDAEKLDLHMMTLVGGGVIVPQLLNGSLDSTLITPESLLLSKTAGGPNFDFRFVFNWARNTLYELAVLDSSPIRTLKDVAGKKVGVGGMGWGNVPGTKAILSEMGVDIGSVEFIAVGDGAPSLEALKRGQIDALNLYDTRHIQFEQQGVKIRRLPLPARYVEATSLSMPFTNKMIRERPDLVARFGRAMTKGLIACEAAIDNCIRAYWVANPDKKPKSEQEQTVLKQQKELLTARLKNMLSFPADKPKVYGAFSDDDFTVPLEALGRAGLMKATDKVDVGSLYTNMFVDKFNDFDKSKVIAEAQAFNK